MMTSRGSDCQEGEAMGTITKALSLLNQFSRLRPEIGLIEMTKLTGRDKATVHRHLTELTQNGFLEQNATSRLYRLGPAILRLASVRETNHPIRRILRPLIEEAAETTGELAHFSLLQGDILSPVFYHEPRKHGTQVSFDEAETLPLHATSSGLAVLAFGPDELSDRVLSRDLESFTEDTITNPDAIRALMQETRQTGFAFSPLSFDREVSSLAVPIIGSDGYAIGGISIAIPQVRVDEAKKACARNVLRQVVIKTCNTLGHKVPPVYVSQSST